MDLLGVHRAEDGTVTALEMSDLNVDEAMTYGAWVGALVGLGAAGEGGLQLGAIDGALMVAHEYEYGLDEESLVDLAADIPLGGAALLTGLEHRWAIPLREAVRSQGGVVLVMDFLNPESLIAMGSLSSVVPEA